MFILYKSCFFHLTHIAKPFTKIANLVYKNFSFVRTYSIIVLWKVKGVAKCHW